MAAFTLASALCALAPGIGLLIAARAVQGLAAAPLVPLAMSMLLGKPGNARSISPAAGIMLFAAPALGPVVGGLLIGSTRGGRHRRSAGAPAHPQHRPPPRRPSPHRPRHAAPADR